MIIYLILQSLFFSLTKNKWELIYKIIVWWFFLTSIHENSSFFLKILAFISDLIFPSSIHFKSQNDFIYTNTTRSTVWCHPKILGRAKRAKPWRVWKGRIENQGEGNKNRNYWITETGSWERVFDVFNLQRTVRGSKNYFLLREAHLLQVLSRERVKKMLSSALQDFWACEAFWVLLEEAEDSYVQMHRGGLPGLKLFSEWIKLIEAIVNYENLQKHLESECKQTSR